MQDFGFKKKENKIISIPNFTCYMQELIELMIN